jgi:hypothetical protein
MDQENIKEIVRLVKQSIDDDAKQQFNDHGQKQVKFMQRESLETNNEWVDLHEYENKSEKRKTSLEFSISFCTSLDDGKSVKEKREQIIETARLFYEFLSDD